MVSSEAPTSNARFGVGLARAFAGAVIFGLPMLMTMEMWWLGFTMPAWKLALLLALFLPFLVALAWHAGFETTFSWRDDVLDAFVAWAVGFVTAALVLGVLGLLEPQDSLRETIGKVSLQAVPGSIGALLAQTQLGQQDDAGQLRGGTGDTYASELFIMATGALFLAFNLAPTEEMLLIGLRLGPLQALLLMLATLAVMHLFVYSVSFRGAPANEAGHSASSLFLRFTVAGYALVLALSAYLLWTFGTIEGLGAAAALNVIVVLAVPAAVGAAAARLIL